MTNPLPERSWPSRIRTAGRVAASGVRSLFGSSPSDDWLKRWLPVVAPLARQGVVLELGCGRGEDTALLCEAGLNVCAVDLSESWLELARGRAPKATFHCQDLRDPFPIAQTNVVIASLSLHYFDWAQTLQIIGRIQATLTPGGILLCRLNSTRDTHFGARGHEEIEPDFYRVNGQTKRFFNEPAIRAAFDGWKVRHIEECLSYRYVLPKHVWEVVLERP